MKREECTIGAKVFPKYDGPSYLYEVLSLPDEEGNVVVKATWRTNGDEESCHLDDLVLFLEEKMKAMAATMQTKVDAAKAAFETAFDALQELRDYKSDDGVYIGRHDMMDLGVSYKELEEMFDSNGWSSSSIWC